MPSRTQTPCSAKRKDHAFENWVSRNQEILVSLRFCLILILQLKTWVSSESFSKPKFSDFETQIWTGDGSRGMITDNQRRLMTRLFFQLSVLSSMSPEWFFSFYSSLHELNILPRQIGFEENKVGIIPSISWNIFPAFEFLIISYRYIIFFQNQKFNLKVVIVISIWTLVLFEKWFWVGRSYLNMPIISLDVWIC